MSKNMLYTLKQRMHIERKKNYEENYIRVSLII